MSRESLVTMETQSVVFPAREFGEQPGDMAAVDVANIVVDIFKPESLPSHLEPGLGGAGCKVC